MHVVEAPPDVTIRPAVRSEGGALVGTLELANAQYRSAMPASIFEMFSPTPATSRA